MSVSLANPTEQGTATEAALLEVRKVAKRFGTIDVLKNISLNIASGEFLTLLGESGSGKTTLLRLIAGFEQPSVGEIWMSGQRLDILPPYRRRVNTVFQNYALFPHLSVRDNIAYGLRVKNTSRSEMSSRVDEALRMVKMQDFAASRPRVNVILDEIEGRLRMSDCTRAKNRRQQESRSFHGDLAGGRGRR